MSKDTIVETAAELIRRAPEGWMETPATYWRDTSIAKERALCILVKCGLLEAEISGEARMAGKTKRLVFTAVVVGAFPDALRQAVLLNARGWLNAKGETTGHFSDLYEIVRVRLTQQGRVAQEDLDHGRHDFFATGLSGVYKQGGVKPVVSIVNIERAPAARSDAPEVPVLRVDVVAAIAYVHGKLCHLHSADAADVVNRIAEANGEWISSSQMKTDGCPVKRPDRAIHERKLHAAVNAMIERSRAKGYRIKVA